MSVQITIKNKSLIKRKIIFDDMIKKLELDFGAYNDFAILQRGHFYQKNQCILFNPKRIGLGIFFDGSRLNKGEIIIVLQTFSTLNEIDYLYEIVKYINNYYKKMDMYLNDDYVTYGVFLSLRTKIEKLALDNLKLGCKRTIDYLYDLRLAFNPFTLSEEIREKFGYVESLEEFEEFVHNKQKDMMYYAAPKINKENALYTFKKNCCSIFPLEGKDFYNDSKVKNVFIEFEGNEDKYSYNKFINIFKSNEKYDDTHVCINKMNDEDIRKILLKLKEN